MSPDYKTDNIVSEEDHDYDSYPNISSTASACECTGLMYAPPQNKDEYESYQDLFNMQIPRIKKDDMGPSDKK